MEVFAFDVGSLVILPVEPDVEEEKTPDLSIYIYHKDLN